MKISDLVTFVSKLSIPTRLSESLGGSIYQSKYNFQVYCVDKYNNLEEFFCAKTNPPTTVVNSPVEKNKTRFIFH